MTTLGDAFPRELQRAREVCEAYKTIGPAGKFTLAWMEPVIQAAETALASGDVVAMLRSYEQMREIE